MDIPEKSLSAMQKKLAKLQKDLDFEDKMQQATEKILYASAESHRPVVLGQLEASGKRIETLRFEIEVYTQAIQSMPTDFPIEEEVYYWMSCFRHGQLISIHT